MSGLPLHWVLYSTRVPTGLMYLDWALQVSLPGWAHSLEEGPNRYGVAWGALFREFDFCCGMSFLVSVSANVECLRCSCGESVEVQLEKIKRYFRLLRVIPMLRVEKRPLRFKNFTNRQTSQN